MVMLDIEKIAIEAVKNTLNSEALQAAIEKKIAETITSELESQFRSYSDFGKAFEAAIKEHMKIDLDNVGFMEYNHFVATTIKKKFSEQIGKAADNQIDHLVNDVLKMESEKIALDDIIEEWRKAKSEYDVDSSGQFAFIVTRGGDSWNDGQITFHLDAEAKHDWKDKYKSPRDCEASFTISMDSKKVIGFNLGHGGKTEDAKIRAWRHTIESKFFRMYASGSVIDLGDIQEAVMEMVPGSEYEADDLDIDTCYPWYDC